MRPQSSLLLRSNNIMYEHLKKKIFELKWSSTHFVSVLRVYVTKSLPLRLSCVIITSLI